MRLRVVIAAAAVSLLGTGCGAVHLASPAPSFLTTFITPDGPVALKRVNVNLAVYVSHDDGTMSEITTTPDRPGEVTIHLVAFGGETGLQTNSFVFGNAPEGATTIEVQPESVVAPIENGVYLVGLHVKDLNPVQLRWTFFRSDGSVVLTGANIKG